MTDWYLAPSLAVLRAEINARWPGRDKTSDGTIGDLAHQSTNSDHNPNGRGSVDAADFDEDGIEPYVVIAAFQRHPSAHYWIYERQIADRDDGWRRRTYTDSNPHDKHAHFSIRQSATAEQDRRPWGLLEDDMTPEEHTWLKAVYTALTRLDGREPIGQAYLRLAEGKDDTEGATLVSHPTLTSLAGQVAALADRPATVIDYDQLADAIVRRALGVEQG